MSDTTGEKPPAEPQSDNKSSPAGTIPTLASGVSDDDTRHSSSPQLGTNSTGSSKDFSPESSTQEGDATADRRGGGRQQEAKATAAHLLHRFNSWKSNPKAAAVASLFRPKTTDSAKASSGLKARSPWNLTPPLAASPLQSAALSPPAKRAHLQQQQEEVPREEKKVEEVTTTNETVSSPIRRTRSEPVAAANRGYAASVSSSEDEAMDNSVVSGSLFSDEDTDERTTTSGVSTFQWAAANVVESVQQSAYFRGRYSASPSLSSVHSPPGTPLTSNNSHKKTMARILSSPQAAHLQTLQAQLDPSEYIMLLGRGMLGVNLKQTYRKHQGVYVDYLVEGGAAERSGVIFVGDVLQAVGNTPVCKTGTIYTVPQLIAAAKRPVHIILSTPSQPQDVTRISHVDIAVALMHQVVHVTGVDHAVVVGSGSGGNSRESSKEDSQQQAATAGSSAAEDDGEEEERDGIMELVTPTSFDMDDIGQEEVASDIEVDHKDSVESFVNPGTPSLAVREALMLQVAKRNNTMMQFSTLDDLVQAAADHANFRAALRNAFLTCVMDGRRFPFLARHFALLDSHFNTPPSPRRRRGNLPEPPQTEDAHEQLASAAATSSSNAMLMLFLEMSNFADLYGVTPPRRRHEIAHRIAHKYFLPTTVGRGEQLVPPMFDFHQMVSDSSLRQLEAALKEPVINHDIFGDFSLAVADHLSGAPFLSYLVSNECARMRAYLRNTAPFVNVPFHAVIDSLVESWSAKNYFLYVLAYLFCLTDRDSFGENDDVLSEKKPSRMEDAASGLCCALLIRTRVLPAIERAKQNLSQSVDLIHVFEQLWESFVAPGVGALSHRPQCGEVDEHLKSLISLLQQARRTGGESKEVWAKQLLGEEVATSIQALADELLYEYASNLHSKFRAHKFHEWICDEFTKVAEDDSALNGPMIPPLPGHCVKRVLRKVEWPVGIAPHKPSHDVLPLSSSQEEETGPSVPDEEHASLSMLNAECAVVFGTAVGLDLASQMPVPGMDDSSIRRYCCESTSLQDSEHNLSPLEIPATLESYAISPESRQKPFGGYSALRSMAGWDASLVNFVVPRADVSSQDGEETSLFGVSLVLRQSKTESSASATRTDSGDSHEEDSAALRKVKASISSQACSKRLAERTWTERVNNEVRDESTPVVIGLALVSQRNVMLAMRETLALLYREFVQASGKKDVPSLVDLLGNFAYQDVEPEILFSVLEPFLRAASETWLERPPLAQKLAFEIAAGRQLVQSIPPIPLSLLFITALLEQKIVFSSSRRSALLSATVALSRMLKPLKWCHLLVPCVPVALAADLLQYPAPYILGMASEDPGIMDVIRELPEDVTLVDLDVGRVILAPSFAHSSELGRGTPNNADTARALRSQVLYLAQSLGSAFGRQLEPELWMCDDANTLLTENNSSVQVGAGHPFDSLRTVCRSFVEELLAGTTSCCYWIEEAWSDSSISDATTSEPTILFDEDRFFHVKNVRNRDGFHPLFKSTTKASGSMDLALSLDDFDLVLELFLRCQSMNDYIGTSKREDMAFSL